MLQAVLGLAVFVIALPWLANRLAPHTVPLPFWLRAGAGGILFVGGMAVALVGVGVLIRRGRGTPFEMDAPRNLVTTGPFAVVRNPIDAGEQAMIWSAAFYFSSLGVLLYVTAVTLAVSCFVLYLEEPELRERFGKQYEDYCRRVPRLLPKLGTLGAGAVRGS